MDTNIILKRYQQGKNCKLNKHGERPPLRGNGPVHIGPSSFCCEGDSDVKYNTDKKMKEETMVGWHLNSTLLNDSTVKACHSHGSALLNTSTVKPRQQRIPSYTQNIVYPKKELADFIMTRVTCVSHQPEVPWHKLCKAIHGVKWGKCLCLPLPISIFFLVFHQIYHFLSC